ncbi:MAG: metallophosphoesterase family protein [Cellulomonadaceae bacterium]|nr:metallophosphoesterase family protein [Cellulomonadaceae bacterium]
MATFYTADTHFGHANLLNLSGARGAAFSSIEEMNETLIANWNNTVSVKDTVWVLGDFDMGGKDASLALLPRLNGTKILIAGNHDRCWAGARNSWLQRARYLDAGFAAILDWAVTTLPSPRKNKQNLRVMLSHFPYGGDSHGDDRYAGARLRDEGVPLLHGHVHEAFRERRSERGTWMVNVGVDLWDYRPVSESELAVHLSALGK